MILSFPNLGWGPLTKGFLLLVSGSVFDLFKSNWLDFFFDDSLMRVEPYKG